MVSRRIFVVGYPGQIGGAGTECWHTIQLWCRGGLSIRCIPTWKADPQWRCRLDSIGCKTIVTRPNRLAKVPGLAGSIVVAFCNRAFLRLADEFRRLHCRVVWLGCMNWLFQLERRHYHRWGPFAAYVFQSQYQYRQLLPQLAKYGVTPQRCHLIRGAFLPELFPFCPLPHRAGEPIIVGRISRPAPDKFSPHTWRVYGQIGNPVRALVLGWSQQLESQLGPPPRWAKVLPPGAISSQEFFRQIHVMIQLNDTAIENWPRSGLEAMSSGVPVVADRRGGWTEMIEHGESGFLVERPEQASEYATLLARDEKLRLEIAHRARGRLVNRLASPEQILRAWLRLFDSLD